SSSSVIEPYLRDAKFLHVAFIGLGCKLDPTLVSALVERRKPEMHTFHIPCSECTITLEDVHIPSIIEPYLRDAKFLHVAFIGRGCKLDPTLVSALVERRKLETHTFHIPCSECTITLEDVQLQLELPMDGSIVTGSVHIANWRDVCQQLLRRVPETIFGAWIDMNWLIKNFNELNEDSTEVQREQHAQVYILMIIGGLLIPDKSRNLVHLRWLLKLVNFRKVGELN
ncbi:hypothetical protein Goshw_024872, partial [Gossypium schwendimanii]|nr:hypothetical protein [Gossypium schwendimanii]